MPVFTSKIKPDFSSIFYFTAMTKKVNKKDKLPNLK